MRALVAAIHVFEHVVNKAWMARTWIANGWMARTSLAVMNKPTRHG
jgi:hypothetical protein